MPSDDKKQIKILVPPETHQLLHVAAALQGISLTEFVRQSAIDAATEVVGEDGAGVADLVAKAKVGDTAKKSARRKK